jgi:uncharacterized protein (TIGR00730 family)
MSAPFSLCVYCGSRAGRAGVDLPAAQGLGRLLGERGWRLVYGGGNVGLMGAVADAALSAGSPVLGVIPRALLDKEVGHRGLTELRVVDTMHQRKQAMAEAADAFCALPGGIGTLEELFEVWTWNHLGYHDKPLGLLNVNGYWDGLIAFMHRTVADGFVSPSQMEGLVVDDDPSRLLDRLAERAGRRRAETDYPST